MNRLHKSDCECGKCETVAERYARDRILESRYCPKCGACPYERDIEKGMTFEQWLAAHPCGYQGPDHA